MGGSYDARFRVRHHSNPLQGKPALSRQSAPLPQGSGRQGVSQRGETVRGKVLAPQLGRTNPSPENRRQNSAKPVSETASLTNH